MDAGEGKPPWCNSLAVRVGGADAKAGEDPIECAMEEPIECKMQKCDGDLPGLPRQLARVRLRSQLLLLQAALLSGSETRAVAGACACNPHNSGEVLKAGQRMLLASAARVRAWAACIGDSRGIRRWGFASQDVPSTRRHLPSWLLRSDIR